MTVPEAIAIAARRGRRRDDQHGRRERDAADVPGAARVRLLAGRRERLQHGRPRRRAASRASTATGPSSTASAGAPSRWRWRPWPAGSPARSLLLALARVGVQGDRPVLHRLRARARRRPAVALGPARPARRSSARVTAARATLCRPVRDRRLRRLLRRRPGDPAARRARAVGLTETLQRVNALKNVLATADQPRRRRSSSSSARTSTGGSPPCSPSAPPLGGQIGARGSPGACRRRRCARLIVAVGIAAIVKLAL